MIVASVNNNVMEIQLKELSILRVFRHNFEFLKKFNFYCQNWGNFCNKFLTDHVKKLKVLPET